jgi:hypothetical protein
MSSNSQQQPYWYSVQYDGGSTHFGYIDQQGTTVVSLGGTLVSDDGRWFDPTGLETSLSATPFGEAGSTLVLDMTLPDGNLSPDYKLSLAFKTAVDFTQPLSLDQLSLPDSTYQVIEGLPPYMGTTAAVQEVTPTTGPTT